MSRVLGIDLGTTFLKGAVLDLSSGTIQATHRVEAPASLPNLPAGHFEIDPCGMLDAVRKLVRTLLSHAPDANALMLTSQMHCVVLTDGLGKSYSNIITWKDQRGAESAGSTFNLLQQRVGPNDAVKVGREVRLGLPIATLFWMSQRDQLPAGRFATSLPDFVLAHECGTTPTTEATIAAAHGLFDLANGDWHYGLIERLGLASLRWPRIRPSGEVVGTWEIDGRRLTCFTPVGDQQCALTGADLNDRELSLNISTGSQVSLLSNKLVAGDYQVRPYLGGRWLRTIVQVPAGRSLAVLMNVITEYARSDGELHSDPWEYVAREVERTSDTDLDVSPTFFASGFGERGTISNIGEQNLAVGGLFVAAFRWMARTYAQCASRLSPTKEWDRIVFSGGIAQRFPILRKQILAELGTEAHRMCPTEEDTLRGLLLLGRRWISP